MNDFMFENVDTLTLESEICNLEIRNVILLEAGNSESIFEKVIKRLREFCKTCVEKVVAIFNKIRSNSILKKAEDVLERNPSLKSKTVKIPDYDKLDKLSKSTLNELPKSKDPEKLVEKYKKQRNALLISGGALASISLLALFKLIKNNNARTERENALHTLLNNSEKQIHELAEENLKLDVRNSELRRDRAYQADTINKLKHEKEILNNSNKISDDTIKSMYKTYEDRIKDLKSYSSTKVNIIGADLHKIDKRFDNIQDVTTVLIQKQRTLIHMMSSVVTDAMSDKVSEIVTCLTALSNEIKGGKDDVVNYRHEIANASGDIRKF